MILPVTLSLAAACAVITLWLMVRCVQLRVSRKVLHGDGGEPALARRMRAQLNFIESAPFVLVMVAAVEFAGKGGQWLGWLAGIYVIGRILHPFGMDSESENWMRGAGVAITMLVLLGLALYCGLIAARIA